MRPGSSRGPLSPGLLSLTAVLLLLSSSAFSFSFYDALAGGTPLTAVGALSASSCGQRSTYAWDALALFQNPAGLALLGGPTATVSGGVMTWKEILSYSYLRRLRSSTIPGSRCLAGAVPVGDLFVASAGLAAVTDADYSGEHLLGDPSVASADLLEILRAEGAQYEALAGLGVDVGSGLSVGASAGMRFGDVKLDYTLFDLEMGQVDSSSVTTLETSELAVRGGAMITGEIGTLGVSYCGAGVRYPASIAAGAEVVAPHIGGVRAGFELQVGSPLGRNDIDGRFNLRYPIADGTQMIAGVSFGDYTASLGQGMGFSVGGSRTQGPVRLDLGVHWWSRNREGSAFKGEAADGIEDSTTEFAVGLTYLP
jgi:hypothetical protein